MPNSVFLKPKEFYTRQLDPLGQYVNQMSIFLSIMTEDPVDKCKEFISRGIKENKFPGIENPKITYFERDETGDKSAHTSTLTDYIYTTISRGDIIVPSFTTYLHPDAKKSLITKFVLENTKKRSIAKKLAFKAKADKDEMLFIFKNNEQNNMKLKNNSLSGAFVAKGSFVNNPTAHSTLTSTTRTGTSLANATNERTIAGNRHYFCPDVVINNIISIVSNIDYDQLSMTMEKFNMIYPSIDDVMNCIVYSSNLYWYDFRWNKHIRDIVTKLTPLQRAAFVYTGDLYHIRKHNDKLVREFISELSAKAVVPVENALDKVYNIDEFVITFAHQICSLEVSGLGKDYKKMDEKGVLGILVATAYNIINTVYKYKDFIQTFFITNNIPPSVGYIRDMIRRCVVISDTDSTCFATGEWVDWMRYGIVFDEISLAISGAITYFASQTFMHTMALFSANINVAKEQLHTLAYKSEWTWTIQAPMNVAKHYFARAVIQEGNVFDEPELELKGVHLKSSNSPPRITEDATVMINIIMDTITSNKKISLMKHLTHIANLERFISESLIKGELEFYRQIKIKEAAAYTKSEESSPYQHHLLWKNVFAEKYGDLEEPPYAVAKIPSTLENSTKIAAWLASIKDREFATRMGNALVQSNRDSFNTFYISTNFLKSFKMPVEIQPIIDTKRVILDLLVAQYMILESLGFYKKEGMTLTELGY